ncbi:hypothetical protein [uncultured Winogradskyella sp.]|uniref:hypothetical protein n=1 Tax=uncultured Winogradskyella sp. TaxID=395353 RepID=UPI0026240B8D|nr:hypothetical protein [uncultured Winogradskyella sp.]
MKTKLLALLVIISIISSCEKDDESQTANSSIINIPDENFKNYLIDTPEINTNGY